MIKWITIHGVTLEEVEKMLERGSKEESVETYEQIREVRVIDSELKIVSLDEIVNTIEP